MVLSEVYNSPFLEVLITLCTLDVLVVVALIVEFVVYLVLKKQQAAEAPGKLMEIALLKERYRRLCEELGVPFEDNDDSDFEAESCFSPTLSDE